MKEGYSQSSSDFDSLSGWQLINEVYQAVLLESSSLSNLVLVTPNGAEEKLRQKSLLVASSGKLSSIIAYLGSLLDSSEGAKNLGELYGWYLDNLDIVCSPDTSVEQKQIAGDNLVAQSRGFIEIWQGMKNAA